MRVWPLVVAALCPACARFTLERELRHEPILDEAFSGLVEGQSDLEQCLAALGAPLWVWEHAEGGEVGAALAYGWFDEKGWSFRVSVPVRSGVAAYFDYANVDRRMRGAVLFFDREWRLTHLRTGFLRDLTREVRRPPAWTENGELEAPGGERGF